MRHVTFRPLALAIATLALGTVGPCLVHAQDRPDEQRDHRDDQRDHRDDHPNDDVARYRHDHPHAAARCHDGFFTTTRDRARACSKHGGIDVWLIG